MNSTNPSVKKELNVLMITHHRRFKTVYRSQTMAKHLVNRGHHVTLMTIADERKYGITITDWDGVYTVETPDLLWDRLRSGWDIWDIINRVLYLRKDLHSYDLIHCFETRPATIYPALFHSRIREIPLLTDWNDWWGRGGIIEELRPKWYRYLFGGIETYYEEAFRTRGVGITVISSALGERALKLGVSPEKVCHIPGGANTNLFKPRNKEECCQRVKFQSQGPILCFSSLDSHLDLDLVFRSIGLVSQKYPEVKLIITGNINHHCKEAIKKHNVEKFVFLTGFLPIEELPWYLGCADIFLLPFENKISNAGRWPNKIGDYMAMGRPTISNPVGEIKKLFETYEVGLLAEWDPTDFAHRILTLLKYPNLAQQIGKKARKVAVTIYDWEIITKRLEKFYYFLLSAQAREIEFEKESSSRHRPIQHGEITRE